MIQRKKLVQNHNPKNNQPDKLAPLTVGNGEFAFTVDITGMQTFYETYEEIPLCTQSQWGWHSFPKPEKIRGKKLFLAAPLHHHFEAKGWPQHKVTMRFWIIGVVAAITGVIIHLLS